MLVTRMWLHQKENIKAAKNDRAELNKLIKAIEEKKAGKEHQ